MSRPVAGVDEVSAFAAQDRIGFSGTDDHVVTGKGHHVVLAGGPKQERPPGPYRPWVSTRYPPEVRGRRRINIAVGVTAAVVILAIVVTDLRPGTRGGVGDAVVALGQRGDAI